MEVSEIPEFQRWLYRIYHISQNCLKKTPELDHIFGHVSGTTGLILLMFELIFEFNVSLKVETVALGPFID